jgi:ferredoxin--NADP+ reductase
MVLKGLGLVIPSGRLSTEGKKDMAIDAKTSNGTDEIFRAKLLDSTRITPENSREEVRELVFRTEDEGTKVTPGSCVRVLAPGEYGNRYHVRLYSVVDCHDRGGWTDFSLAVRRCFYIDDFNGEEYPGVASNYLCDLRPGDTAEFGGPVSNPFEIPESRAASLLMLGMGTGIAPFRGLVRRIYEELGGWQGKVRLFHGAKTGLDLLYRNEVNNDLGYYYDEPTFKAFQAVSPRPALDVPVALDVAMENNAEEVWGIVNEPDSRVFVAGVSAMLPQVEKAMGRMAGSPELWAAKRAELVSQGRWKEVIY